MARSAQQDPVDKFRFIITLFESPRYRNDLVTTNSFARAGFSEVGIPSPRVNEINYRENTNGATFIKIPGLVKYDPITLRRGVTGNIDLYNWYKLVNNDAGAINSYLESLNSFAVAPAQSLSFRKEMLISLAARDGSFVKHWMLYNAFPVSYKGGNDLSASSEEKLIEELTVTYETFVEVTGDTIKAAMENIAKESRVAAQEFLASSAIGAASGILGIF